MADIKKDQERDELFRTIYKIATDLVHAGHVAEWDCVRRSETTAGPLKSDTLTAENRHPFRWSDSWRNWRGDRHAVSPHAVCFIP